MPEIPMPGCTPEPLMSYLKALGVFRLVAEQADPDARLSWRGGIAVLHTSLHRDRLERFFLEEYRPTPISSPWNGGSGFYRTWDSKALRFRSREAVDHVSFVQQSTSERLLPYREALSHVQAALNQYARPIDVRSMPEKERKATLLLDESSGILDADQPGLLPYLRATLPDESVCWLDTALLLQTEDTRAAPLFISGGNDGNFDFSVTFIGSLRKVFAEPKRSVGWLKSSVFADGGEPLDAGTAGHFNPAGLGGPNGGQGFVGTGGVNPWDFVFMMEGAVMMAGAVSRRFGTQTGDRSSFPFCVSPVAIGFGSADKSDESSDSCRTELWLPQWSNASTLAELRYLFAEGRAQFGRGQARNAVQFALATCMLGVNRGIDSFVRFSFLRRFGKMFLAVPLGRIPVTPRPTRQLLDDPQLVNWIDRLRLACRDNDKTPARFQAALRDIDQTIFAFANRSAPGGDAKYLLDVLRAVGRAERTFATEGLSWLKDKTYGWKVRPLFGLLSQWLDQLVDQGAEFRLAASLAGIRPSRDGAVRSLRAFLEPVEVTKYVNWSPGSTTAVWSHRPLAANLAAVFRRRQMEAFRAGESGVPLDSLRWARLEDVLAFLNEQTDDEVLADLIWGLIAVKPDAQEPFDGGAEEIPVEFGAPRLLVEPRSFVGNGKYWNVSATAETNANPDPDVFHALASGRADAVEQCVTRAARRLKSGGLLVTGYRNRRQAGRPLTVVSPFNAERLLAAMLFPLSGQDLERIAKAVLYPPASKE